MALIETIDADIKTAMKARETARVQTLRMLKSELKNRQIEAGRELNDDDVQATIRAMVKKRRESIDAYRAGGRDELADKEAAEVELLSAYLPAELGDDEILALAKEAQEDLPEGQRDQFGPIMGGVMRKVRGRADGNRVQQVVRKLLEG